MSFLAASLAFSLALQPADVTTQTSTAHGLQWSVPKTWKESKRRDILTYRIPTSAGEAAVEVFATNYRRPKEEWQRIQAMVSKDLGRTVARQWEEELLQVPLLFTQVQYGQRTLLIGILYTATAGKFHFRLDSPSTGYEEAEKAWRGTLNTIRPLGGSLPTAEDGKVPLQETPKPKPTEVIFTPEGGKPQFGKGLIEVTAANRTTILRFPKDFSIERGESGYTLVHPDLSTTAKVQFYSTIDSPEAGITAMNWINKDLANFTKVSFRENYGPRPNRAKTQIFYGWRTGEGSGGNRSSFCGVGDAGGFYWFLTYESKADASEFRGERRVLDRFFKETGFDIQP